MMELNLLLIIYKENCQSIQDAVANTRIIEPNRFYGINPTRPVFFVY